MESTSRQDYQRYQSQQGHKLTTVRTGLMISSENPWLATSPDDEIHDEESSPPWGLAEYKNPFSVRHLIRLARYYLFTWKRKKIHTV